MDPSIVDCRSLIEFCRAFEMHRASSTATAASSLPSSSPSSCGKRVVPLKCRIKSLNPLSHPFCEHSPVAAIDAVILLLVIGAVGVLTVPYFNFIFHETCQLLPAAVDLLGDVIYHAPVAYGVGLVLAFVTGIGLRELIGQRARKCGKPYCKGLKKAVEFDIQLEPEDCVRYLPSMLDQAFGTRPLELGHDHKELEAELKKMAPLNGRTVLIFRATCGCPKGRMEVWGPKRSRRLKK